MKKEYINPEMEVIMLNTMPLLEGSDPQTVNEEATSSFGGVYDDNASLFHDNGDSNESW